MDLHGLQEKKTPRISINRIASVTAEISAQVAQRCFTTEYSIIKTKPCKLECGAIETLM